MELAKLCRTRLTLITLQLIYGCACIEREKVRGSPAHICVCVGSASTHLVWMIWVFDSGESVTLLSVSRICAWLAAFELHPMGFIHSTQYDACSRDPKYSYAITSFTLNAFHKTFISRTATQNSIPYIEFIRYLHVRYNEFPLYLAICISIFEYQNNWCQL